MFNQCTAPSMLVASVVTSPQVPRTLMRAECDSNLQIHTPWKWLKKNHIPLGNDFLFASLECPGVGKRDGKWRENLPCISVEC